MDKIRKVLEGVYNNESLRRSIVPLFIGNTGLGKTVMIEQFAKDKGVTLVELITSQMSPFEVSGIAMPDKESKKMTYFNFDKLENLKDGDILFFDELLNGNPVVLNACLTVLEQRRFISGKPLPNIMIVAAANPQGMAPLTPQIKERFVWYEVKFNAKMWQDFMFNKYFLSKSISSKLVRLIEKEDFTTNNFYTPRSIDKATDMTIIDIPTPYEGVVKPILQTLIENKTGSKVILEGDTKLEPNEQLTWLDLIRYKNNISIEKLTKETTVEKKEDAGYDIVMLDEKDNIIGNIKNVDVLKSMYYFSNNDIVDLNNGSKVRPIPQPRLPPSFLLLFFQKKIV